jgi:hypothetical protein
MSGAMDEELRAFLGEQFGALRRELSERFADVHQRIVEVRREIGVVIERQQDEIRLIAEGHVMLRDRIDAGIVHGERLEPGDPPVQLRVRKLHHGAGFPVLGRVLTP